MGAALLKGLADISLPPARLAVFDVDHDRAERVAKAVSGEAFETPDDLAASVDLLVLAVKPDRLKAVVDAAGDSLAASSARPRAVASVLAGTSLTDLRAAIPEKPIFRLMPNIAVEFGKSPICFAASVSTDLPVARDVMAVLAAVGTPVEMSESLLDLATAVVGGGPAFLAVVYEGLVDGCIAEGLGAEDAGRIVRATFEGTAALLDAMEGDSLALRRRVTSPGGTTAEGIEALERHGVRAAVLEAVRASTRKAAGLP